MRAVDDLRAALGHRVRELRDRLGLTQEQLAERADLHPTYVSGIERGERNPGLNILARLAKALRVALPALVTDLRPQARVKPRPGRPRKRARSAPR
jgi:transcriptional regulator with XRE-family HTH domain